LLLVRRPRRGLSTTLSPAVWLRLLRLLLLLLHSVELLLLRASPLASAALASREGSGEESGEESVEERREEERRRRSPQV
jgi:hypothetical protein